MKTKLGGDRLGSGNKQEIAMKNYERSTHDLGYIWRSSMASGTLVPFMSEVGLPGDSFDIDLDVVVKTLPTVGPLFGSYKVQLDVFACPIRLYQGKLHMNMLNIGMDMSEVALPQIKMESLNYDHEKGDNQQINSSSIYSYLNMRGLGKGDGEAEFLTREFNAIPYLGYWDIYKNYYANKQEERGYVIHNSDSGNAWTLDTATWDVSDTTASQTYDVHSPPLKIVSMPVGTVFPWVTLELELNWDSIETPYGQPDLTGLTIEIDGVATLLTTLFQTIVLSGGPSEWVIMCSNYNGPWGERTVQWTTDYVGNTIPETAGVIQLKEFPLENIDSMRMDILEAVRQNTAFIVDESSVSPYGLGLGKGLSGEVYAKINSQEGLGIKTYQSDLFNNWISTEWIDGDNGINEITSVDTGKGSFTIDSLNLANRVYNMLNRIALSGGDYDSWLDAVYTHERAKGHENPIYQGSLIKELAFEEVVSMSDVEVGGETQPLGTLAGRGRLTGKNKGGRIKVKVDEPSYIMGIVSLTPRIDYSQGNKWDTNLKTMNDFHKPALDEIGFQDLVTDQMAWFDTELVNGTPMYKSAGKQPAWINYMTNVNQTRGTFAEEDNSMFMTLNRKYGMTNSGIGDLTTYVDPSKFNSIFAQTSLDSQNFWVQISNKITARRKMSAKVIPNL